MMGRSAALVAFILMASGGGLTTTAEANKQEAPSQPAAHWQVKAKKSKPDQHTGMTMSSSSSSSSVGIVTTADKTPITKRRPLVDAGLRYSSNDWIMNCLTTPTSYILQRIRFRVLFDVLLALAAVHFYPKYPQLAIPMVGHTLLASSLGLLLSYRTNSAYGRFWEARGHWTTTKAACRNLAIFIKCHLAHDSPKAAKRMLELLAAYPSCLMHLCLGGASKLPDHAAKLIPEPNDTFQFQEKYSLPAFYMCMELHRTIRDACEESNSSQVKLMEAAHLTEMTRLVVTLLDTASCCEKILRTPVPWTYSRHTSRFLTLWMSTLPFALLGTVRSWALLVGIVFASSYCLFGIEEISHLIEQPFLGDPLDGADQVWSQIDDDGHAATLMARGRKTQPYDIGIPVCSLAAQIRNEVLEVAQADSTHRKGWFGGGGEHRQ